MQSQSDNIIAVQTYMEKARSNLRDISLYPRKLHRYPFDSIALSFVSKGFSLSNACLVLLREGQAEEAYGLSRSLVECALTLRYLTKDEFTKNSESIIFMDYSRVYKNFWLHHARKNRSGTINLRDLERVATEWRLSGDPEPALRNWSKKFETYKAQIIEHPLDDPEETESDKSSRYAVDYKQTSQFVHCTQPGLDNFFPEPQKAFEVQTSLRTYLKVDRRVPLILLIYLHAVIRYALFGLGHPPLHQLEDSYKERFRNIVST